MALKITVIGTGYLGATHAAAMAELGFEVLGLDVVEEKIDMLRRGEVPMYEPGLEELLRKHVDELAGLTCPACGLKYGEFRSDGRLGCPHDYEVFRAGLAPLLKRIHRAGQHVGKSPRRDRQATQRHQELIGLRRQLREAVDEERYERAAQLRDLIRAKESQ